MAVTMDLVLLTSPTKYAQALAAIVAELDALSGMTAVLDLRGQPLLVIADDASLWPDGSNALAVVTRGVRQPSEEERGSTAAQWIGGVVVQVVVREDDPAQELVTLDAVEVAVVNALRQVQVEQVTALWDLRVTRIVPLTGRTQGAVPPYAGSQIEVEIWAYE